MCVFGSESSPSKPVALASADGSSLLISTEFGLVCGHTAGGRGRTVNQTDHRHGRSSWSPTVTSLDRLRMLYFDKACRVVRRNARPHIRFVTRDERQHAVMLTT